MIKIKEYQYCSGDHKGEAGVITFDKCQLFQITDYKNMKITEQVAYFNNGKIFKKYKNEQWVRIE